jgi:anti-sigma28 factor (negative regulator of flagellin synthesis)
VAKENKGIKVDGTHKRRTKQEMIVPDKISLLSKNIREEKVIVIRQQLAEGKYDINKRLNVALDKIIENLAK